MANTKKTLYVGGLADEVDLNVLKSAFSPFGDLMDVNLPLDYTTQKHKGFAFIEYQLPEDAADAIDNMHQGEILGRTIKVNIARPTKFANANNRPIWADDAYLQKVDGAGGSGTTGDRQAENDDADNNKSPNSDDKAAAEQPVNDE